MPAKLSAAPRIAPKVSTATEMHSRHLSHLVVRKRDTTAPTTGATRSCLYQKDGSYSRRVHTGSYSRLVHCFITQLSAQGLSRSWIESAKEEKYEGLASAVAGRGEGGISSCGNSSGSSDHATAAETSKQLLHGSVQRFRGGLVFKAFELCVSLDSRLESNTDQRKKRHQQKQRITTAADLPGDKPRGKKMIFQ